jgi:hypothetical protein
MAPTIPVLLIWQRNIQESTSLYKKITEMKDADLDDLCTVNSKRSRLKIFFPLTILQNHLKETTGI